VLPLDNRVVVIGIAGASASGKSSLATAIVDEFSSQEVIVISEDSYYKCQDHMSMSERVKTNYDHPDAFDHDLLISQVSNLVNGKKVDVPVYNHSQHTRDRSKTTPMMPAHIIVLEGILLFCDSKMRELMDIKIYVDTDLDLCLLRRLSRDVVTRGRTIESFMSQYQETVRPMFLKFIEPSKRYADIIVPTGGKNKVAINLIKAQLKELLNSRRK
jgi:uridine kinase